MVHTAECGVGKRLFERDSERWIDVDWAEEPLRAFETGVALLLRNGKGALAQVAAAVSAAEADVTRIHMAPEPPGAVGRGRADGQRARPPAPGRSDAHAAPRAAGAARRPRQALSAALQPDVERPRPTPLVSMQIAER